ncbi:MAG: MFS transporter, partial [Actinomycetota bacterium]|nr:MFS transporter [Actinomycetota bacterium]
GRKTMLVLTLTIMGVATTLIGLLPPFAAIGIAAPLLLVVLRFVQGLGVGGEWGGAVLMAVEHSPADKRGFFGSWPQMGVPAGLILSNLIFLAVSSLPEEQFLAWGWRIPFLLSIILVAVGLFIRLRIMESPAFRRVQETNTEARMPIVDVLRTYPKQVLLAAGAFLVINAYFYILVSYLINYATAEAGMSNSSILNILSGEVFGHNEHRALQGVRVRAVAHYPRAAELDAGERNLAGLGLRLDGYPLCGCSPRVLAHPIL